MKKSTILLIGIFILGATSLIFALQQSTMDKIIHGFNTGDAELIASFCDKESLLELFDSEEYEGKVSIKNRLEDFFTKYPPRSFRVQHEGGKQHPTKEYLIGVLQCEGEAFRITLALKNQKLTDIQIIFKAPAG